MFRAKTRSNETIKDNINPVPSTTRNVLLDEAPVVVEIEVLLLIGGGVAFAVAVAAAAVADC